MTNPDIREAVEAGLAKRATKLEITAEFVLSGIARVTAAAEEAGDAQAALRGHELLGKYLRLFADRVEHSVQVSPLAGVDTQALIAFVQRPQAALLAADPADHAPKALPSGEVSEDDIG